MNVVSLLEEYAKWLVGRKPLESNLDAVVNFALFLSEKRLFEKASFGRTFHVDGFSVVRTHVVLNEYCMRFYVIRPRSSARIIRRDIYSSIIPKTAKAMGNLNHYFGFEPFIILLDEKGYLNEDRFAELEEKVGGTANLVAYNIYALRWGGSDWRYYRLRG